MKLDTHFKINFEYEFPELYGTFKALLFDTSIIQLISKLAKDIEVYMYSKVYLCNKT